MMLLDILAFDTWSIEFPLFLKSWREAFVAIYARADVSSLLNFNFFSETHLPGSHIAIHAPTAHHHS